MLLDAYRRSPRQTGDRSTCPTCSGALLSKCGALVIPHWAHVAAEDCDPWAEPESAWHLEWKQRFPEAWREVVVGRHRADIRRPDGLVVELQHSALSVAEIAARERAYPRLIWIFNATDVGDRVDMRFRDRYMTFRWKHSRRSLVAVRARCFLDLGGDCMGLFEVRRLYHDGMTAGWGYAHDRVDVVRLIWGRYLTSEVAERLDDEDMAARYA